MVIVSLYGYLSNGGCACGCGYGQDGCIYAIPLKCERVLRIDPTKGEDCASLIGGPFEGLNLWEGGVEGCDGALYCMPLKCDRVMRIAPAGCEPLPSNRCTVS